MFLGVTSWFWPGGSFIIKCYDVVLTTGGSTRLEDISSLVTERVEALTEDPGMVEQKCKAIIALFPYAARQEWDDGSRMFTAFLRALRYFPNRHWDGVFSQPTSLWRHVWPVIPTLLVEGSPIAVKRAAILVLAHVGKDALRDLANKGHLTLLWKAVTDVPHTDEICRSVVDTMLQIASLSSAHPQEIPANAWLWLKKLPSLPPACRGRHEGSAREVVRMVRALKDVEVLKSYLLLIWSEWDSLTHPGFQEIWMSIQEDFSGIGMICDRADLRQRLDHILGKLESGTEDIHQQNPNLAKNGIHIMKHQYRQARRALVEFDQRDNRTLTGGSPFFLHLCSC